MASNNASGSDAPKLSNDELAVRLIQCATMVKKGEKGQIIRDTIYDLTYYLTGKVPNPTVKQTVTTVATESIDAHQQTSVQTPGHASSNAVPSSPVVGSQEGTVSKHRTSPLKAVLGRVISSDIPERSQASKAATSDKNAARARADILNVSSRDNTSSRSTNASVSETAPQVPLTRPQRPAFHRPGNPNSPLIANGWIEQHRRSKMLRTVWKEVLASLVDARRPGEETTFWVQRETGVFNNGRPELEALHQIPVKWIKEVKYDEYAADFRFSLRVANVNEEFVFRCSGNQEAAQNWVLTLRSATEMALRNSISSSSGTSNAVKTGVDDWEAAPTRTHSYEDEKKLPEHHSHSQHNRSLPPMHQQPQGAPTPPVQQQQIAKVPATAQRMSVKELRAIAHGAGIQTHGMERRDLERVVQDIFRASQGNPPASPSQAQAVAEPSPHNASLKSNSEPTTTDPPFVPAFAVRPDGPILASVSSDEEDRRRMMNEATKTMNGDPNSDVSRAVEEKQHEEENRRLIAERVKQQQAEESRRLAAERVKQQQEEEQRRLMAGRSKQQQEEEHRRSIAERVRQQQETEKRMKEEEERKRLEQERLRKEEEAHQKRVADLQAAAERKRQEELQRTQQMQWQQQQQEWQKQQAEQERRRQEEAFRAHQQQQQWQQQQQASQPPPNPQWNGSSHARPGAPNFGPPPPNMQQPFPPGHQQFPPGQNQFPNRSASAPNSGNVPPNMSANMKYAKMAQQTEDDSQASLHAIKHGVLLQWALCPPTMQILKPIQFLLAEMPIVFPPKFNVAPHDHFSKWTPMRPEDVCVGPGRPDPEKLNKTMRKLRLFLHPDKLPRDFTKEQEHLCKLLWDITSDAYEDFKKGQEDLGWIR